MDPEMASSALLFTFGQVSLIVGGLVTALGGTIAVLYRRNEKLNDTLVEVARDSERRVYEAVVILDNVKDTLKGGA